MSGLALVGRGEGMDCCDGVLGGGYGMMTLERQLLMLMGMGSKFLPADLTSCKDSPACSSHHITCDCILHCM